MGALLSAAYDVAHGIEPEPPPPATLAEEVADMLGYLRSCGVPVGGA